MKFTHLHTHSHYSLLDGLSKIDEIIKRAKECEMDSIALTDHGTMYGAIEFYKKAKKAGIKPIIGCEVYVAANGMHNKRAGIDDKRYHLVLLAKNDVGYKNLIKLVSKAHLEGFYYKPRIDKTLLKKHSEGLIGLSACLAGEVSRAFKSKDKNKAKRLVLEYKDIFAEGDYYIEIQEHPNIEDQNHATPKLIELARETGIPLVATQDSHYTNLEDSHAHDVLLAVQTGNKLDDKDRLSMKHDDFSLLSGEAMYEKFKKYGEDVVQEALNNTNIIAEKCNLEIQLGKTLLPHFPLPEGYSSNEEYLSFLTDKGLKERYGGDINSEIEQRLEYEMGVIKETGFASYFLIVQDFVNWAKENGIVVGPGRGSASGSLVSYLLNITNVDPIKYNLLFERFLNPERISMPDIDLDFDDERRNEVFEYAKQKYGRDHFAQIITFGTMAARGSIRDAGRALGFSYDFCDQIAKMIPLGANQDKTGFLKKCLETVDELKDMYRTNPDAKSLIDAASKLEGVARHSSTHACAVVITPKPLTDYLPLQRGTNEGDVVTQYEMHAIEDLGLLKMDFLGLSNLTIIQNALKEIKRNSGEEVDMDKIALDDKKTFKLLREAKSTGVFQFESGGMKRYLKELKPTNIEDIIAMVSLYRPGPMDLIPEYISRKNGQSQIQYLHPSLEPVLNNTYGIMVYQEQLIEAVRVLAGFSRSEADVLRKAVGKKIKRLMDKQEDKFKQGAKNIGTPEAVANKFWSLVEPFNRYAFNRCLAGDTLILDHDTGRLIKIKDLANGKKHIRRVLSMNKQMKLVPIKVMSAFSNGTKRVFEITTRSGRKIKATNNHPFFGIDGWTQLKDLCAGDRLAVPRVIKNRPDISCPSYKLAALGYLLSEGNLCHPHGIYFYSKDDKEIKDYASSLESFKNTHAVIGERIGAKYVYSKRINIKIPSELVEYIESLDLKYKKATEKFIPAFIFKLKKEKIAILIAKMFQGDGCINIKRSEPQIFYATSSEEIASQLQHLLLRFEIISTIHEKGFKYRNTIKRGFTITINRWDNISKFIEAFSDHLIGEKQKNCQWILDNHPIINGTLNPWVARGSKDILPSGLIMNVLRAAITSRQYTYAGFARSTGLSERLFGFDSRKIGYLRETIQRASDALEDENVSNIAYSDIFWDEIKTIKSAGKESTYDLEIDKTHNFVANDFIVHNSHAACYATIAYQTAYLKANYPIEFMSAFLNSETGDIERVAFLIEEAKEMGIDVLPPAINQSFERFAVVDAESSASTTVPPPSASLSPRLRVGAGASGGNEVEKLHSNNTKKIRFGLTAIKNVGSNIVKAIIEERSTNGQFKDIEDFVSRIQNKDLNKKSLESLIKCGAMDTFGERNMLVNNLEQLLFYAREKQKQSSMGQVSLFGGNTGTILPALRLNDFEPAKSAEKLTWEKDLLGLFVSDHPLNSYQTEMRLEKVSSIKNISATTTGSVKIGGLITRIQKIITKTGKPMLFSTIEDLTSKIEVIVFPNLLEKDPDIWKENNIIVARGKVNDRDGSVKLLCNEVKTLISIA